MLTHSPWASAQADLGAGQRPHTWLARRWVCAGQPWAQGQRSRPRVWFERPGEFSGLAKPQLVTLKGRGSAQRVPRAHPCKPRPTTGA